MEYDRLFDREENKALLAICTRKLIGKIGIGGIVWGLINIAAGIAFSFGNPINIVIILLGVMMLGTGVRALKDPSLRVLLLETFVASLLFVWNLYVFVSNASMGVVNSPITIIVPLVVVGTLAGYYKKLKHLRGQIASVEPEQIKAAKQTAKTLVKKKLKDEPFIIQSGNRKCRAQLLEDTAFFIQRDLMRAFVATREEVRNAVAKPGASSWKTVFQHPLGKLTYAFNKKNTAKLKGWIDGASAESAIEPPVEPAAAT